MSNVMDFLHQEYFHNTLTNLELDAKMYLSCVILQLSNCPFSVIDLTRVTHMPIYSNKKNHTHLTVSSSALKAARHE